MLLLVQSFNGLAKARVMHYESINLSPSVNFSVSNFRNEECVLKNFTTKISGFMVLKPTMCIGAAETKHYYTHQHIQHYK